jgi:hypothetical protein
MKKIVILLLSVTSIFAVAETYQFKTHINSAYENSLFTPIEKVEQVVEEVVEVESTLVETGPRGTISLRGTNGLTSSSYLAKTSSNIYYKAERAFNGIDGHGNVINSEYDVLDSRSVWFNSGARSNDWIQVDFGQDTNIARFAINTNGLVNHGPRDTIVQISNDGANWVNHQEVAFLAVDVWQPITLDSPVLTRFFRLAVVNNHGGNRISIGEIEIYQN